MTRRGRIFYAILWILTVLAYSVPWARAESTVFVGWNFTIPFSITYVIGIILGLIVLATKRWAFGLTILAGILMLLGIVGAAFGYGIMAALGPFAGERIELEAGIGLAFLLSIIYMIGGAILVRKE